MKLSRNTLQRELVLQAVRQLHNHPTAEDIYQCVAAAHPSISKATVYRNLGVLAENGEVKRVSHLNAADRFDYQTHPHYHFRCEICDSVFDVDLPYNANLLDEMPNPEGFDFRAYEITFTGLCNHCKKNSGQPA